MPNNIITMSLTNEADKPPPHSRSADYDLDNGYGWNIYTKTLTSVVGAAIGGGLNHCSPAQLKQLVMLAAIGGALYGATFQPIVSAVLDGLGLHKGLTFEGFNHPHFAKHNSRRVIEDALAAIIGLMIAGWLWQNLGHHQTQNSLSDSSIMMAEGISLYEIFSTLWYSTYHSCDTPAAGQTTAMPGTHGQQYVQTRDVTFELVERNNVNGDDYFANV